MRCREAMEWMSARLDGQLEPRQDAALSRHLETCAACRQTWAVYQQMTCGVRDLEAEPPTELYQRVMEQVVQTPQITPAKKRRLPWGIGTAAATAVVLLLLLGTGYVHLPDRDAAADTPAAEEHVPQEEAAVPESAVEEAMAEDAAAQLPVGTDGITVTTEETTQTQKRMTATPEESAETAADTAAAAPQEEPPQLVIPWSETGGGVSGSAGQIFSLEDYLAEQTQPVLVMTMSYPEAQELLVQWKAMDYLEIPAELAAWETVADGVWQCRISPELAEQIASVYGGVLHPGDPGQVILLLVS